MHGLDSSMYWTREVHEDELYNIMHLPAHEYLCPTLPSPPFQFDTWHCFELISFIGTHRQWVSTEKKTLMYHHHALTNMKQPDSVHTLITLTILPHLHPSHNGNILVLRVLYPLQYQRLQIQRIPTPSLLSIEIELEFWMQWHLILYRERLVVLELSLYIICWNCNVF